MISQGSAEENHSWYKIKGSLSPLPYQAGMIR